MLNLMGMNNRCPASFLRVVWVRSEVAQKPDLEAICAISRTLSLFFNHIQHPVEFAVVAEFDGQ